MLELRIMNDELIVDCEVDVDDTLIGWFTRERERERERQGTRTS